MRRWIVLAMIASLALGVVGCSGQREEPRRVPDPAPLEQRSTVETAVANAANEYSGRFRALNGSALAGGITIRVDDDRITVRVSLEGADAATVDSLAIHGFRDGRLAQAPPSATGVASRELAASTGPALLALAPFSVTEGAWSKTLTGVDAYPLDIRAVVLWDHADPSSSRARPLAYALLRAAELGDGGSGGPGLGGGTTGAGGAGGGAAVPGAGDAGSAAGSGAGSAAGSGATPGSASGAGAGAPAGSGATGAQSGGAAAGAPGGPEGGSAPSGE